MKKCLSRVYAAFFVFLVLNIGIVMFHYMQKDGFHVDEIFSFAHANSTQGAFMSPVVNSYMRSYDMRIFYEKWTNGADFHNYITVQPKEAFKYRHIWENLKVDVHPPLYYVLLHTVCSFFPDVFSKWLGAGLNVVIWGLLLFMTFRLAKLLLGDEFLALLTVMFYAFSEAGIDTVLFIRMYVLQTLFAVCLIYETVKMLKENQADNKRLFLIFLYSSLGMLTQYSSLVFSFLVAGTGGGILFLRRNWHLLLKFAVAMALSPLALWVVFPATFDVLLHSARGEELIGKVHVVPNMKMRLDSGIWQGGIWEILRRVDLWLESLSYSDMWKIYFQQLWGFPAFHIVSLELLLCVILLYVCLRKIKPCASVWYVLAVCVLMGVFLSRYMPPMYEFSVRYYMLLLPLASVLTFYLFKVLFAFWGISSKRGYVLLGVFVLANSLLADFGKKSAFAFNYDTNTKRFLEDVKQRDVVVFTETSFMYFELVAPLYESHQILVLDKSCQKDYAEDIKKHKGAYVMFFNTDARRCVSCAPKFKTSICLTLMDMLQYKFLVRVGERYYDVYEVLKDE